MTPVAGPGNPNPSGPSFFCEAADLLDPRSPDKVKVAQK